jgi:hypothetical protein
MDDAIQLIRRFLDDVGVKYEISNIYEYVSDIADDLKVFDGKQTITYSNIKQSEIINDVILAIVATLTGAKFRLPPAK